MEILLTQPILIMTQLTVTMSENEIRKIKEGDVLRMSKGDFEVVSSFFDEDIQEQTILIIDKGRINMCANGDIIEVVRKK